MHQQVNHAKYQRYLQLKMLLKLEWIFQHEKNQ